MAEGSSSNSSASNTGLKPDLSGNIAPPDSPNEQSINPAFLEFTTVNEYGLVELNIDKIERTFWKLNLDETTKDETLEEDSNVRYLTDKLTNFLKISEESEISSQNSEQEIKSNERDENLTEQEPKNIGAEKLTEFKYEKKNNLWNQKPHLRQTCKEFYQRKFGNEKIADKDLDNFTGCLLNNANSDLLPAVNILSRIAYPKLNEKHFLPNFPFGESAEEKNYDTEDISISMEHFKFSHEELVENFFELFQNKDFDRIAKDWEKNPEINNFLPSLKFFLKDEHSYKNPVQCFAIILAILKNPYSKFEFHDDENQPVEKEQDAIAIYLISCLTFPAILADKDVCKKLIDTIISFSKKHKSFLALTVTAFNDLFSKLNEKQSNEKLSYEIYCQVLTIMISIGGTLISLCLPEHFNNIYGLALKDQNCELYFCLLRACEVFIADVIENQSQVEAESSEGKNFRPFYSDCYNYFEFVINTRLGTVFRKYEMKKSREECYLVKKHSIYPSKHGYLDTEMELIFDKYREEPKPPNLAKENKCIFNSDGKLLCLSNAQFGYMNDENISELSNDSKYPLSYLETVNKRLF